MEEKQSRVLVFFKRIFLAITDFRLYPYVQREKVSVATAYFTLLILLISLFISLHFSNSFLDLVSNTLDGYEENVPEFIFDNSELFVAEKIYNMDSDTKFIVDTSLTNKEFLDTEVGKEVIYSKMFLVLNSDGLIYGSSIGTIYPYSRMDFSLNKSNLHEVLKTINDDWTVKSAIMSVTWLCTFIVYFIIKMINVFTLIFMAWILNIVFNIKLKFSNYYRVVVYAITLPLIIELISILYLGRIPEVVTFVYQLLAYIYIFYALRALKLDYILINAPGNNFKEKIESMINKLENEIEDKMKNDSEEEKKEQQEKNDSEKDDE